MSKLDKTNKLTLKQKMFVKEYLIDLNATQAAIRAGYSENTAFTIGCENLTKPLIQVAVQKEMDKRSKRVEITADMILQELSKIAFFDIRKLYNADGSLKEVQELDDETARVVAGLDVSVLKLNPDADEISKVHRYKISDKQRALELLGKHLVLFTDKLKTEEEVTINVIKTFSLNNETLCKPKEAK